MLLIGLAGLGITEATGVTDLAATVIRIASGEGTLVIEVDGRAQLVSSGSTATLVPSIVVQVSPPDKHGFCSLGASVDVTLPAVQKAKKVIAQLNPMVPRTHGDGIIHIFHDALQALQRRKIRAAGG